MTWEPCRVISILQKMNGTFSVTFVRTNFMENPIELNFSFGKSNADQFFGIDWNKDTEFALYVSKDRYAIKGKRGGNVLVGPIKE